MWDIFRGVLGLPPLRGSVNSTDSHEFLNRPAIWEDSDDDSSMEDNFGRESPFSMFATSVDDDFHRQMNQLMQAMFGITSGFMQRLPGSLELEDQSGHSKHIRDQFFKPGAEPGLVKKTGKDSDLDGRVENGDVEKFFGGESSSLEKFSEVLSPQTQPRIFSRSIMTRTVRRSDGTVETVRTERDHTGREETTVTTYEPEDVPQGLRFPIQSPPEDDLLSKFFNF